MVSPEHGAAAPPPPNGAVQPPAAHAPGTASSVSGINFAAYRKPELAEALLQVLNFPLAIITVARTAFIVAVLGGIASFILFQGHLHPILLVLACTYAGAAAGVVGMVLGLAIGLDNLLKHTVGVTTVAIQTSEQIIYDLGRYQRGDTVPPSLQELVRGVFEQILWPTLHEAVTARSPLVGRLFLRFYQSVFKRVVDRLLQQVQNTDAHTPDSPVGADPAQMAPHGAYAQQAPHAVHAQLAPHAAHAPIDPHAAHAQVAPHAAVTPPHQTAQALSKMDSFVRRAIAVLEHTRAHAQNIGSGLRQLALTPLIFLALFLGFLATIPLALTSWLAF